ncbi:restriction endonuclease subunit S [Campylobacter lari]|uniref:restriction endonuclease subunit S n=1 Tax=Campylobacter lari TaxID=201 RepID=UPI0011EAB4A6|nr:restriction endonuclease subunit S [Campylobacter lari]KAB0590765.1 restriction endonuclease subunit S [Campylobacter lari subsp. concheus]MPC00426.1 restriction endonuclease subunit S [Campylobacter lari]QEL06455.1 type I restriction/modification system, specificity subunit [Campylobacter lari subsp. concheus]
MTDKISYLITNLPQGWKVKTIEEVCKNSSSNLALKDIKDKNGQYPVFGASGIVGYVDFYHKDKECLGIVKDGAGVGRVFVLPKNTSVIGTLNYLETFENTNLKYLFHFLCSVDFSKYVLGSAIPHIYFRDYKKEQIPLPPLKEQERIVEILDESFAKIDESIKILEQDLLNLDELMQSAMQKAFNPLKDNIKENYKLPQGWEWKSLGEICFITDGTHKTPNYIKTGIPFLSVKNISKGFFDLSDIKYISLEEHNKLIKRAKPEFGDILICRIGTLGKAIKISLDFEFSIFVSLGLLKPKIKIISDYLVYFLNSYFIEGWIDNNKVGGGTHTAKLNLNILEKCPIALPSLKEQEQIVSYLDEFSSNVKNLKQNYQMQIKNLQELKKSLLDKAFQGRL